MQLVVIDKGAYAFIESDHLKSLITLKSEVTVACVQIFFEVFAVGIGFHRQRLPVWILLPTPMPCMRDHASMRHEYISKRLVEIDVDCLIVPFLHEDGSHWQLVVLCKKSHTVLFLCLLHYKVSTDCKNTMNSVMKMYVIVKG